MSISDIMSLVVSALAIIVSLINLWIIFFD